jgi:hypothetical protein
MGDLCRALGTSLEIKEDLEGRPVGVIDIQEPGISTRAPADPDPPFAAFPAEVEEAALPEAEYSSPIPETATSFPQPMIPATGVELLAASMPDDALEGGMLFLTTWWRVTEPVDPHVMLAYRLDPGGEIPRRGTPWYTRHDAADWTVPLSRLKPGTMVEDFYPARLAGLPAGTCKVHAVLLDSTRSEEARIIGRPCYLGSIEIRPRE